MGWDGMDMVRSCRGVEPQTGHQDPLSSPEPRGFVRALGLLLLALPVVLGQM